MENWLHKPLIILVVAATEAEAEVVKKMPEFRSTTGGTFFSDHEILFLVTGVGSVATAWALTKWISSNSRPDLALNIGISGSFNDKILIGDVVIPVSECFADSGIDTGKEFLTLSEAGLCDPDEFPFNKGIILSENRFVFQALKLLKPAKAATVNTATGSADVIKMLTKKFKADIETMEGATFFYICSREKIPFLAIRSVSNMVGPRDKEKWNISLALENLQVKVREILLSF